MRTVMAALVALGVVSTGVSQALGLPAASAAEGAKLAGSAPQVERQVATELAPKGTAGMVIRAATYNVCKVTCGGGRLAWENRRRSVVRTVAAAQPDVLATQEMSYETTRSGLLQWQDLSRLLNGRGYERVSTEGAQCAGCTRGTHILFRRGVMELSPSGPGKSAGLTSLEALTPTSWRPIQDRAFAWAYLRHVATGKEVLVLSVHLPNEKTAKGEQLRKAAATALSGWVKRMNRKRGTPKLPTLLLGDLNSFALRQPQGAQQQLRRRGFTDSFTATKKVNADTATANYGQGADGWPAKPVRYSSNVPRIDYIFGSGLMRPLRYEVFLRLTGSGRFRNTYRGSDHNLVSADWRIA